MPKGGGGEFYIRTDMTEDQFDEPYVDKPVDLVTLTKSYIIKENNIL
ncbi:hypothetical protein FM107_16300 [Sphingobacterium sp. JB170]|nr:hypothetical protein FM107_16300 [Sphingobacterium sp. JB170]